MTEYYHFTSNNELTKISQKNALETMDEISPQWEEEITEFGKLFMGIYDWDFDEKTLELKIPKIRTGGEIPLNKKASLFFGFEIFGACFLKPKTDQIAIIDAKIDKLK